MSTRIRSVSGVVVAALGLACPALAHLPARLGPARTANLGAAIGHILGTQAWGIDFHVNDNGTPAQQNARTRKAAPKIVVVVRRYEHRVAQGACRRSLHQLELAWAQWKTLTTNTAAAFDRAYLGASQRVNDSCT